MKPQISLIVAHDLKYGISRNNKIPWFTLSEYNLDKEFFKSKTLNCVNKNKKNALIFGKNTFLDINKPLMKRENYIISSTLNNYVNNHDNLHICNNLIKVINDLKNNDNIENIFICGGNNIYLEAIKNIIIDNYYITTIKKDFECDNILNLEIINHFNNLKIMNIIEENEHLQIKLLKC